MHKINLYKMGFDLRTQHIQLQKTVELRFGALENEKWLQ